MEDAATNSNNSQNKHKSTRGASRKNRVYVFREWLLKTYGSYLSECRIIDDTSVETNHSSQANTKKRKRGQVSSDIGIILDVAGGKGDLSWLLKNADGLESIVVDPWKPDPKSKSRNDRMAKSIEYLRTHPEEAQTRSVPFLPTYQPLAALLPQLLGKRRNRILLRKQQEQQTHGSDTLSESKSDTNGSDDICHPEDFLVPRLLQIPLDKNLVQQVEIRIKEKNKAEREFEDDNSDGTSCVNDGDKQHDAGEDNAIDILSSGRIKLIVGFHPDQATEPCVDLARVLGIPFCVVPCCVFPAEFPDRRLQRSLVEVKGASESSIADNTNQGGQQQKEQQDLRVRTYQQFLEYLKQKHSSGTATQMQSVSLEFAFTETAKNVVLYTLPPSSAKNKE